MIKKECAGWRTDGPQTITAARSARTTSSSSHFSKKPSNTKARSSDKNKTKKKPKTKNPQKKTKTQTHASAGTDIEQPISVRAAEAGDQQAAARSVVYADADVEAAGLHRGPVQGLSL